MAGLWIIFEGIRTMKSILAISALGLSLIAGSVAAAPHQGSYAGISLGSSTLEVDSFETDLDDTQVAIFLGRQLNQYFATEVGFTSMGDVFNGEARQTGDLTGIETSALGFLPVSSQVSVFGRLGYWSWDSDFASGQDLLYGVGVEYNPNERFQVRLEAKKYELDGNDAEIELINGSVGYRFF